MVDCRHSADNFSVNVPIHLSPLFAWIGEVGVLDVLSLGTAAGEAQVRQELACVRDVLIVLRLWSNHGHGDNDGVIMPIDLDGSSLALRQ